MAKAKRAVNGSGHIRQRPDGRWEAQVLTPDGKRRSVYGATQKECREKLTQIQASIDKGIYTAPQKLTFAEWLDIWQSEYLTRVKESTRISYEQHIRNHIAPALGKRKLSTLNALQYQGFINDLTRVKGLNPKTVKNIHGVAHEALDKARKLKYISFNPADDAELPRIEKPAIQALDPQNEVKALLSVLDDGLFSTIIKVDLFTGMRESEILGLTWDCVDFDKGVITINKQLSRPRIKGASYALTTPKNGKTRTIQPAPYVMSLLKQQRQRQLEQRLFAGSVWDDHGFPGLCFTYPDGKFVCYQMVLRHLRKSLKDAGLQEHRFHDLRHSYTGLAHVAGHDWKEVSESLGHFSVGFTLDTYAHLVPSARKESAQRMESLISTLNG